MASSSIHLATVALNQTPRDWVGNAERLRRAFNHLRELQVQLACLPELVLSGYGCEDSFFHPATQRAALATLAALLPETKGLMVNIGMPIFYRKALYNGTVVIADEEILGVVPKKALAGDGIHYEPRWFKPWPRGSIETIRLCGFDVPIGDLLFEVDGVRVGYEICEEAWIADRPGRTHSSAAVDIECNPSASHFERGKDAVRERFVREGSRAFHCVYLYSNLLGCESGRQIYDGGGLISHAGEIVARGERFSFQEVQVTSAVVDLQRSRGEQAKQHGAPCFVGFEGEKCGIHTVSPGERFRFSPPSSAVRARSPSLYWEQGITDESREFEEFSRAASLGLFDYLRKSRSRGYVVSLSGGCDSTAVVVLARMAILRAFRELGADEFRERLAFFSIPEGGEPEVLSALLTTVWQGTENNSPETLRAAQEVARVVGSRHHESDIDPWVALYRKELEGALGRSLSYEADGLVLQNLQARVRAPLPWGLANAEGKLLLTTSNRSEAAFGYCTMDGDTAGGLNPIGGVGKHFLRQWLRWCETTSFREELGVSALPLPLPQLHLVNALAPSAELLPPTSGQADEKELGPYALAARIEECYFREGRSPSEILELLQREFSDSKEDLRQWITNFFESFARSQWKRERLAPSFHLDSVNLDPRTWCRWPILSGGFQEELREISQEQKEDGDEHE